MTEDYSLYRFVKSLDNSIADALADPSFISTPLENSNNGNVTNVHSRLIKQSSDSSNDSSKVTAKLTTNLKLAPEIEDQNSTSLPSTSFLSHYVSSSEDTTFTHKDNQSNPVPSSSMGSQSSDFSSSEACARNAPVKRPFTSDLSENQEVPRKKMMEEKSENESTTQPSTSQDFGFDDEAGGAYDELD